VQPDYTSNCQAAKSAGAQLFLISLDPNSVTRLGRSSASIDYHPLYVTIPAAFPTNVTADPNFNGPDGIIASSPVLPWLANNNPGIAQMLTALGRYSTGLSPAKQGVQSGWVSAKLFEFAATRLSEPPTSQSLLDALWTLKNNDLGGLAQPLTFSANQNAPQSPICYWILQVRSGNWMSPNNNQRSCL
jgi:branched-chain amino acid transport system substrate-binding protein